MNQLLDNSVSAYIPVYRRSTKLSSETSLAFPLLLSVLPLGGKIPGEGINEL